MRVADHGARHQNPPSPHQGRRRRPLRRVLSLAATCALLAGLVQTGGASAATQTTCQPFGTIPVAGGVYNVQNNEWNSNATQCLSTDGNADFSITQSGVNAPTNSAPGSYPSIYRGCHWGTCTPQSGLPALVGTIGDPTTSWSTTQPGSGAYDVAYDIWFNRTPTTAGQPNGAEVMVWLNHQGPVQPAGAPVGTAALDGYTFQVWSAPMGGWTYVAYVIQGGVSSVTNLNLGNVFRDAAMRGYLDPTWYLIDVEAGFELWQGGAGLATNSFAFNPTGPPPTTTSTTTISTTTTSTTTTTTTTTGPGPSPGPCRATYRTTGQWQNGSPPNGFTANVTVQNTGTTTMNQWTVRWSYPAQGQQVTNAWNASVTQVGADVSAVNAPYNGTIPPGGTQTFGFQGTWSAANPTPANLMCS